MATLIGCLFNICISPSGLLFARFTSDRRENSCNEPSQNLGARGIRCADDSARYVFKHGRIMLDMNYKMSPPDSDAASRRSTNLSKGYSAVFITVFIWSVPSLFMFYLNRYYDPWAQNFYRYSVACIAIAPFLFYQIRRGGPPIGLRAVKLCLPPCLPNVVHQVTQVMALFYIGPGVY